MSSILKYFLIGIMGITVLTACKKEESEEKATQVETKIVIHTTVTGLGKVAGVHVFLHYFNNPPIEQITDADGKAVYENVQPGYYYGKATYDDGNGNEYMIGIPTFRVDEGKIVEKEVKLE